MAGEYDGSEPLKSLGGDLVPQVWDATLNGGNGGFRVVGPSDLGGGAPLAAPSGNIPLTTAATGAAAAVSSGACTYGFYLVAHPGNGSGLLWWGASGADLTHGAPLPAGGTQWIPCADAGAVFVVGDAVGLRYSGVRM